MLDHADLASALGLPASAPTAQVVGEGWRRFGDSWFDRVDADFAVTIVGDHRPVYFYRSRSGTVALYAAHATDGGVVVATELAALRADPGLDAGIDRRSLHEYLRLLDIAPPRTLFAGIFAVAPGELALWEDRKLEPVAAAAAVPAAPSMPATLDAAVDELDGLLHRAVLRALAGAARPAAFLSGGIDSALLCAIAARHRPDLVAVTVGFEGAPFDETPTAAGMARHLGLTHEVLRFPPSAEQGALHRLAAGLEQPMADPAGLTTLLSFEHCARQYDLTLDGTGADEALGLMPARHRRLAVGMAGVLPTRLRHLSRDALRALPRLRGYAAIFDFEHPAEVLMRWGGFRRDEIAALCGEPVALEHTRFYRTFARYPRGAHFERYSALLDAMPCERLREATRLSGATLRFPFLAPEVDGWLRRLPRTLRHGPAEPKRVLRALLARYLPPTLWDRPKHGFDFPLADFLDANDFAVVRHHLDPERWAAWQLCRPEVVQGYLLRYRAGDTSLRFRIWALVLLGAWLETHPGIG